MTVLISIAHESSVSLDIQVCSLEAELLQPQDFRGAPTLSPYKGPPSRRPGQESPLFLSIVSRISQAGTMHWPLSSAQGRNTCEGKRNIDLVNCYCFNSFFFLSWQICFELLSFLWCGEQGNETDFWKSHIKDSFWTSLACLSFAEVIIESEQVDFIAVFRRATTNGAACQVSQFCVP